MDLNGRNVVITGASQGIGAALAETFAAAGAHVMVVARSAQRLEELATRINGSWLAADLTNERDVDTLVERCLAQLGSIDVFVNNAGVETEDAFAYLERGDIRTLARLNLEAPMMLTRDVLPHFLARGTGHFVMTSSLAGAIPFPGLAAYSGSKAGLTNFAESLRLELRGTRIGITVVAPGPVDTEMWDRIEQDDRWAKPALDRFRHMMFLPKTDPIALAHDVVDAVRAERRFVRPKRRFSGYHMINNAPRRLVEVALTGVRFPDLEATKSAAPGSASLRAVSTVSAPVRSGSSSIGANQPSMIWATDNPPSKRWTMYTRGNVGEVFPEVVLPLTWTLYGGAAERGWRKAFERLGLLMPEDFDANESMVILGVFGGYCYINASYVRLLGVRAPGGTVPAIDKTFFGESAAPPYKAAPGHTNRRSSLRLGATVLRLLRTTDVANLSADKDRVRDYLAAYPGSTASDDALVGYLRDLVPLFEHLFFRHIDNTFSVALVSGALVDLVTKAKLDHLLVSLLGGIGDVESAAPSAAMWRLATQAQTVPSVKAAFDEGRGGLHQRLQTAAERDPEGATWCAAFATFLDEFGSRGPNEWDLGSDPWAFKPDLALAAIDAMRAADASHDPHAQAMRLAAERSDAVKAVRAALNPVDRLQFDRLLRATTLYSQARERSKTTIIAAIHGARVAHRVLAERLAERGGPTQRWQACLYTLEELPNALANPQAFSATIAERTELHTRLSNLIPPFIVEGSVPPIDIWEHRGAAADQVTTGTVLRGIAGCPGVARGRARVVLDPGEPGDLGPGDVLVAPITDPSWTPLFLAAEAVVVDVGATMSHAVIVSRELGIPCVVSALDATRRIPNGALIEVDGGRGTVTVLELP